MAADSHAPRDGSFIEIIGHYDSLADPEVLVINEEKAIKWLKQGAKSSATVTSLLKKQGILDKFESGNN